MKMYLGTLGLTLDLALDLSLALVLVACHGPEMTRSVTRDAPPAQPTATVRPVVDQIYGTAVVDPYRWMEDLESSEFQIWAGQQNAYTRATLDQLSLRGELLERLSALATSRDEVTSLKTRLGVQFYLKRPPTADAFKLYVRHGDAPERLLIDPDAVAGAPAAIIDYYEPSPSGRRVAFGLSANGSETSTLHVVDVVTGELLPEAIDRAWQAEPRWLPDETGFFYHRDAKLPAAAPTATKHQGSRNYLHALGADPDSDPAVFGDNLSPEVAIAASDFPLVYSWPGCPYALGVVQHGISNDLTIYTAPLARVNGARTPWKRLASLDDQVLDFAVHGSDAFLLTHKDAPRGKLIRTRLDAPDLARAEQVVAPSDVVVTELAAASDALYVRMLDRGIGRMMRIAFDGSAARRLDLPLEGTLRGLAASTTAPGFAVQLDSWTRPSSYLAYDPAADRFTDLGILPEPQHVPALESVEATVTSADGTRVPLSIVYLHGLDRSRPHPARLVGYGHYGMSVSPGFDLRRLAWYERGGIYAVAHVRGGGEFGEEWHLAGMKQNKQRTVDDYLACARYLIDHGYTSPHQLAGEGISAGGLTVGSAITQHPELFGAALIRVGVNDAIRYETTQFGPQNAKEFGTSAEPSEFQALYAMSPYYHVVDHTQYPAVLLTAAAHDSRVPVWQPGKLAARLQAATGSGKPVLFRLEPEAGHGYGMGTTNAQLNEELADLYAFLLWQLTDRSAPPRK